MPSSKKEGLIFGVMMCFGMVIVMSLYNAVINGTIQDFSMFSVVEIVIGLVIALLLDIAVVGPLARKIAFSLPIDRSKKINMILAMSTCMVIGMVLFMSVFGLVTAVFAHGLEVENLFIAYLMIAGKNVIMALPLQLLIMGPLVRGLFTKVVKPRLTPAA
ncbi:MULTISPECIES: hypothetical protein [Rossellomorea]|uniref:hypothetical protein n=1 Tax=Rossellomorea TaxID=2837508 RepID=UPI00064FCD2D|nr:hypothetical protein [Rossellomorea marisflavi]KML32188.1 hypothetical protein VL12_15725 [Rossellomorea marisflavi]MBV6684686.1 DUF2798 domain-containing protein [Bacillus sp. JRC01]